MGSSVIDSIGPCCRWGHSVDFMHSRHKRTHRIESTPNHTRCTNRPNSQAFFFLFFFLFLFLNERNFLLNICSCCCRFVFFRLFRIFPEIFLEWIFGCGRSISATIAETMLLNEIFRWIAMVISCFFSNDYGCSDRCHNGLRFHFHCRGPRWTGSFE